MLNRSAVGGLPFPVEKTTFRAVMPAFSFGNLRSHTLWIFWKLGSLKVHYSCSPMKKRAFFNSLTARTKYRPGRFACHDVRQYSARNAAQAVSKAASALS